MLVKLIKFKETNVFSANWEMIKLIKCEEIEEIKNKVSPKVKMKFHFNFRLFVWLYKV